MAITNPQEAIDKARYKRESLGATWNNRKQAAHTRHNGHKPVKRYKNNSTGEHMHDHPHYDFIKGRKVICSVEIAGKEYDLISCQKSGAWGLRREHRPIMWFRDFFYLMDYARKVSAFWVKPEPKKTPDPAWNDEATKQTRQTVINLVALYQNRYNVKTGEVTPALKVYREAWGRQVEFKNPRFTKNFLTVTGLDGEPNKWGVERVQKELRKKILVIIGPCPEWATYEAARAAIGK
jgi:hypothetical protein